MQPVAEPTAQTIEHVFRQEYGRILATLIRVFGDFDVAEDALQEAFIAAVEHWQSAGIPENAAAWLTTTARNKGVSRLRRERTQSKLRDQVKLELEVPTVVASDEPDLLRLIFTCCHPALNQEAQVALTCARSAVWRPPKSHAPSCSPSRRSRNDWCAPSTRSARHTSRIACLPTT
jgi:predicted RNA polymerase sigma factor